METKTDNIETLRSASAKLIEDKKFIAYYLSSYSHKNNIPREKMMELLKCNQESYYKAAAFEVPIVENGTYLSKTKLNEISVVTGLNFDILFDIIQSKVLA